MKGRCEEESYRRVRWSEGKAQVEMENQENVRRRVKEEFGGVKGSSGGGGQSGE